MYLLHIRPIPQDKARGQIEEIYEDIMQTLHITTVPLVFQYIAGFEQYLFYIWERIKHNLESDEFRDSCAELKEITTQTIGMLPTPSAPLQNFVKDLSQAERYEVTEVTNLLDDINIRLMLITIAIRESLKGIPHVGQLQPDMQHAVEESIEEIARGARLELQGMNRKEVTESVRMLAPLLGSNTLVKR